MAQERHRRRSDWERLPAPLSAAFTPLFSSMWEPWWRWTTSEYPADIHEDDQSIYVDVEMPGFKKEHVQIALQDDQLQVTAERELDHEGGTRWLSERRTTRFERSFTLPAPVDPQQVEARLEDGVLHLEMKKTPAARRRSIEIK